MVQSEVYWVRNTTAFDPAQMPTVNVFNNYFGGNMASVVFQTLRESKALAYSTFANYDIPDRKDQQYSVSAYIGSQADKFQEAVAGMTELLNALPESGKLLETAKVGMKKSMQTERIRQDGIIYSYLDAVEKGLDYDARQKTYESLDKISYADLKAFADTQLANKPYTLCVVASEKRVTPEDLAKHGTVKKLTLEEILGIDHLTPGPSPYEGEGCQKRPTCEHNVSDNYSIMAGKSPLSFTRRGAGGEVKKGKKGRKALFS